MQKSMLIQGFKGIWVLVELLCYIKTVLFISFTTSFAGASLWWTDLILIIYSKYETRQLSKLKLGDF